MDKKQFFLVMNDVAAKRGETLDQTVQIMCKLFCPRDGGNQRFM